MACEGLPDGDGRMAKLMAGKVEGDDWQGFMLKIGAAKLPGGGKTVQEVVEGSGLSGYDFERVKVEHAKDR